MSNEDAKKSPLKDKESINDWHRKQRKQQLEDLWLFSTIYAYRGGVKEPVKDRERRLNFGKERQID